MQNPEVVSNGRISSKPYVEFLSIFARNKSSLINSTLIMVQRNYADFMIPNFCLETWRLSFPPVLHPNPNDDHPYQVNL
jgi:hypothetical protein